MPITPNSTSTVLDKFNYLTDNSSFVVYIVFQFAMSGTELWNPFPANKFNLSAFSTSGKHRPASLPHSPQLKNNQMPEICLKNIS